MPRTGRPRAFRVENVVDAAVLQFWRHGYESTTMATLLKATKLSSASFYSVFDSKKALFDAVVERYLETFGEVFAPLDSRRLSSREAVEKTLRDSITLQTSGEEHPRGCLASLSGVLVDDDAWTSGPTAFRRRIRELYRARVMEGIEKNELKSDVDVTGLATLLETVQWGIAVGARDGVPAAELSAAVDQALVAWDRSAGAWRRRRNR